MEVANEATFYTANEPKGRVRRKREKGALFKTVNKGPTKNRKRPPSLMFPVVDPGDQVHLGGAMELGLVPELVSEEQAGEDRDGDVVGDKGRGVPITLEEDAPVGEDDDDDGPDQTPPSGVRHELAMPWKVLGADALRLQASSKTDAGETDAEPIEHSRDGAHVGEPAKNGA